jgi:hypothetical protein
MLWTIAIICWSTECRCFFPFLIWSSTFCLFRIFVERCQRFQAIVSSLTWPCDNSCRSNQMPRCLQCDKPPLVKLPLTFVTMWCHLKRKQNKRSSVSNRRTRTISPLGSRRFKIVLKIVERRFTLGKLCPSNSWKGPSFVIRSQATFGIVSIRLVSVELLRKVLV